MPRITAVGTCVPPHILPQDSIKDFARHLFADSFQDIERLLPVFQNGQVETRYFCMPIDWFAQPHSFAEKNSLYEKWAVTLGMEAAEKCLHHAGRTLNEIDHIFFVSTSGIATPSIESHIMNRMGANPHTKRTPIWGLGCAGGAAGLSRAAEYVTAYPNARALLIAVECCGLTFQNEDRSKSNLIATSLFADGAAAVLVEGEACEGAETHPSIVSTMSTLWPDTGGVMGWEVNEGGLKVIFSRSIPSLVETLFKPNVLAFLERHGLNAKDITHFIVHPGGYKVVEAYAQLFNAPIEVFSHSLDVLRRYGNMSSATVLFVLEAFLKQGMCANEYAIITALGPGFSSELLLIKG
ncbi:type III polyketide synthase [Aneurinibacillus terranovensis]|uniref:type III polyketide synthase n=1 Tax=Aneurinibacillus terranovensis TaxID=278991 RepID=UPI0003FDB448|nr:3-oxoacyl-[acyl-carrier-protein] synthase III C-terminal domain-containing protein [Aneurinibacillus terranovensis]